MAKGLSKTAKYYRENPEARKVHQDYQKTYNRKPREVKKRVELNRENRERGTYGNGDKKDLAHTKKGLVQKPTEATINWEKFPILTSRPPEMSYEDYRLHLKAQKYLLKLYKTQGKTIKGYVNDSDEGKPSVEGQG